MFMKRSLIVILGFTLVLSGCEQSHANTTSTSKISGSQNNVDVNTSKVFTTKPILPEPGTDKGEWDVLKLPSNAGTINPVPNNTKWQPMNFGEDKPIIAGNSTGALYMATDAGVWYRDGERWSFMPGTEKFSPITAITVTPVGAPIIATGNQIFEFKSQKWILISDNQETGIKSLDWTKNGQLVAQITYYPQQSNSSYSNGPAPMPIYKMMIFNGTKWYKPTDQSEIHNLVDTSRRDTGLGAPAMGVHYIGISPTGTPTIEFMVHDSNRSIWQYSNSKWNAVNMSGFPVDTPVPDEYFGAKDVTWWNSNLVVSSPKRGAMEWNGATWNSVGNNEGMTTNYHRTGNVMSSTGNTLFAEVKETVPPPPTTPRRSFNTLWEFQQKQWHQINLPNPTPDSLLEDPVISSTGAVAVSDGNDVWLFQNKKWKLIGNRTGIFKNAHVREMKFMSNGTLTIALISENSPTVNNIYEWTGSKWFPLLSDNNVISKENFWFNYTWAPDGSVIIGLMNETGYSVWRYTTGKWLDLGLHGQRPEFLSVTKQDTLFVITDKYVSWRLNLS